MIDNKPRFNSLETRDGSKHYCACAYSTISEVLDSAFKHLINSSICACTWRAPFVMNINEQNSLSGISHRKEHTAQNLLYSITTCVSTFVYTFRFLFLCVLRVFKILYVFKIACCIHT